MLTGGDSLSQGQLCLLVCLICELRTWLDSSQVGVCKYSLEDTWVAIHWDCQILGELLSLCFVCLAGDARSWGSGIFCTLLGKCPLHPVKLAQSCPTLCDTMDYTVYGILQAGILEMGSISLLQIFPNQGSNPGLPHCRQILYQLRHKGSPCIHGVV